LTPAVRVRERVAVGVPLSPQPLEEGPFELPAGAPPAYASIDEAAGCRPRRALAAGEVVYRADCLQPRGVEVGEEVSVVSRAGAAALMILARARSGGPPGAWIWLENPGTRQRFRARVTGRRTAETTTETTTAATTATAMSGPAIIGREGNTL
jgi:flagella basal body P-ring formation protein FlgA